MDKPIDIPANLYEDEVVCFMADRYRTTTERVMQCFLVQEAGGGPRLKRKASLSASRITKWKYYEGC